ncbi:MAG: hemolysin III family protein [Candidatus Pacebacteria bacterium]|nr:hemolysin III family protein [Candidatus Paceibacterota bacterium]
MIKIKDPISGFSHLIGAILAIIGTSFLVANAQNNTQLICFLFFGITAIFLYSISATYHLFGKPASDISFLRKLDHASIYFLIAGSFTPFCVLVVKGLWGWLTLILIWILAIVGASTVFKDSFWKHLGRKSATSLYIIMGWIAVLIIYPMRFYPIILLWIFIGGIFYTIGAVIYAIKKPNLFTGFGFHELFHIFVLLGTISQFIAIYKIL